MATRFEVTVPVVVFVELGDDNALRVDGATIEAGYPGFFCEAESAQGVWNPSVDEWGNARQDEVATTAWFWLRARAGINV